MWVIEQALGQDDWILKGSVTLFGNFIKKLKGVFASIEFQK